MNGGGSLVTERSFRRRARRMARAIATWEHAGDAMAAAIGEVTGIIAAQAELEGRPIAIFEDADVAMGKLDRLKDDIRGLFQ